MYILCGPHPSFISPTCSLSKPDTDEHTVTFQTSGAIRGANLTVPKQTPEAKFSSFVVTLKKALLHHLPLLSGALALFKATLSTSRGVNLQQI